MLFCFLTLKLLNIVAFTHDLFHVMYVNPTDLDLVIARVSFVFGEARAIRVDIVMRPPSCLHSRFASLTETRSRHECHGQTAMVRTTLIQILQSIWLYLDISNVGHTPLNDFDIFDDLDIILC